MSFRRHAARLGAPLLFAVAWSSASLATQVTYADPPGNDRASARKAMNEADRLREVGDLHGAMNRYMSAHAILRNPASGLELASTQAALGLLVEARMTATEAAELPVSPGEPEHFAASRRDAARLAEELEPRVPALTVAVSPEVPYGLRIDGMLVPERAHRLRFRTNPGVHVVEVQAEGYELATQRVSLAEGVHQLMHVALTPAKAAAKLEQPPPPPPPSEVVAEAPKGAAPKPAAPPPTAAPKHTASKPAAPPPTAAPVRAPEPQLEAAAPPPAPEPSLSPDEQARAEQRLRGYIGGATGGVLFLAGAIAGIASITETSSAKRECNGDLCPLRVRDRLEAADTLANVANVTIPLGLLGIGYGLYELLTIPKERAPGASRVELQITAGGAYASVRGAL